MLRERERSARELGEIYIEYDEPLACGDRASSGDETHLDLEAEFFSDLARQSLAWTFARLDLSARELPLARETHARPAAGDEAAAAMENGGPDDVDLTHFGCLYLVLRAQATHANSADAVKWNQARSRPESAPAMNWSSGQVNEPRTRYARRPTKFGARFRVTT